MAIQAVAQCWLELSRREAFPPVQAEDIWQQLTRFYAEPHRRYHTFEHLSFMLDVLKESGTTFTDQSVVELAVLFHDAVYDARRTDNEARSAEIGTTFLSDCGFAPERTARVSDFILATAGHPPASGDDDLDTFLDADLTIFGEPWKRYRQYVDDVRAEYSFVSDEQWRIGRTRVLNHFLSAPSIYRTARCREAREESAVKNLNAELLELGVAR
jgi:predicted metal-dependent HD superfamily phosphohydrolase